MSTDDRPASDHDPPDPRPRPPREKLHRARAKAREALFGEVPDAEREPPGSTMTGDRMSVPVMDGAGVVITRGAALGRYLILGLLGRGGMGTVFKAYDEALDRTVAVKLLRSGTTDRHAQRLRREAQALAKLSHPNVVHVYEVGEAHGQWFIAMEFVPGQTLRRWQAGGHGWRECVRVYLQAGEGLSAAHAAGLIHRDFKPDNCIIDDKGRVRVLDFGLVRDTVLASREQSDGDATVRPRSSAPPPSSMTRSGAVLGTIAYMPPEQIDGRRADARSDQFSFCVSLYEAVYGERPFQGAATVSGEVTGHSRVRPPPRGHTVPSALRSVLLRGLAAEPEARWPSMESLGAELRRQITPRRRGTAVAVAVGLVAVSGGLALGQYAQVMDRCTGARAQLDGVWDDARRQQLEAAILGTARSYSPDTWARVERRLDDYAARWVAKHTAVCEATRVTQEQTEPDMSLRMSCLHHRKVSLRAAVDVLAGADATVVEHAVDLVANLRGFARCDDLEALRAAVPPPEDPKAAQEVEDLRQRLAELAAEQEAGRTVSQQELEPVVVQAEALDYGPLLAEVKVRRGRLRDLAGQYDEAERDLLDAYALAMEHHHEDIARDAAKSLIWVVGVRQARHGEGQVWGRVALAHVVRGGEDIASVHEAAVLKNIGTVLSDQGASDESLVYQRRALAILERVWGEDHPNLASSLDRIGIALARQGELPEALAHQRRALVILERALGLHHPQLANLLNNTGIVLRMRGDLDEALSIHRRAYAIVEQAWGEDHTNLAESIDNIGAVLGRQGQLDQALVHFQRALALREQRLGENHPDLANSLGNIGNIVSDQGRLEEALVYYRRALAIEQRSQGENHPQLAALLNNVGMLLLDQGKLDEALVDLRRALSIFEATLGEGHPDLAGTLNNIGKVLVRQGEVEEGLTYYRRALAIKRAALGPVHPRVAASLHAIGTGLRLLGRRDEARRHYQQALDTWKEALGADHPELAHALIGLSMIALEERDFDVVCRYAERALSLREAGEYSKAGVAEVRFLLARGLWARRSERARARALAEQALEVYQEHEAVPEEALAELEQWLDEHRVP